MACESRRFCYLKVNIGLSCLIMAVLSDMYGSVMVSKSKNSQIAVSRTVAKAVFITR